MKTKIQEILIENKIIVLVVLISLFSIYFWAVRPAQIRKECSMVTQYSQGSSYTNPAYNEEIERQKQRKLVDYIECRNSNLVEGDQTYINKEGSSPYSFTQDQYNTLSIVELNRLVGNDGTFKQFQPSQAQDLETLNQYVLGKLSPVFYHAYSGYVISKPEYEELKENRDKYPQCDFPDDFINKTFSSGGGKYTTSASDREYSSCLRKHGLDN